MTRTLLTTATLLLAAPAGFGQDMPLFTFTAPGETWQKAAGVPPARSTEVRYRAAGKPNRWNTRPGEKAVFHGFPGTAGGERKFEVPLGDPAGLALSTDGGTLFVADAADRFVWAFPVLANGDLGPGEAYATLWTRKGETESRARAMTIDTAGRFYVATAQGVQAFDPTGRLCGVLANPAPEGLPDFLAWEGETNDVLSVWVRGTKFTRAMRATGVK